MRPPTKPSNLGTKLLGSKLLGGATRPKRGSQFRGKYERKTNFAHWVLCIQIPHCNDLKQNHQGNTQRDLATKSTLRKELETSWKQAEFTAGGGRELGQFTWWKGTEEVSRDRKSKEKHPKCTEITEHKFTCYVSFGISDNPGRQKRKIFFCSLSVREQRSKATYWQVMKSGIEFMVD